MYQVKYKLGSESIVEALTRDSDGATIPICPGNRDYNQYKKDVANGDTEDLNVTEFEMKAK